MTKPTFTHLLNPISKITNEGLFNAQTLSLQTLDLALKSAKEDGIEIDPLFISYQDDQLEELCGYAKSAHIKHSVLDYGSFVKPRKLPLLQELLQVGYENSSTDYLIYTNIDICLLPFYYQVIADIINSGIHSLTITRRTLTNTEKAPSLHSLFAKMGKPHRGWDCFIFPREIVPNFILKNLCIGVPLVGLGLLANLVALDKSFVEFNQLHLTFHIGNDRLWNDPINRDYVNHNKGELRLCLAELERHYGDFPANSPPHKYLQIHRFHIIGNLVDWLIGRLIRPAG